MSTSVIDVGTLLDSGRATRIQWGLVALTALAIIFDGIDNQLIGIAVPTLMREWSAPRAAFAPVVSLGYLGMMIGGAAAGQVGDRLGRRVALVGSVIVFGAMTMAASLVDSVWSLGVLRLLTGLGLGGAIPNAASLAAEYVPLRQRPLAVTLAIVCVPLGGTVAGLIAIPALPAYGWRALFVVWGVVPVVAALVLARLLPESPRYLARHPDRWHELRAFLARIGHDVDPAASFVEGASAQVSRA